MSKYRRFLFFTTLLIAFTVCVLSFIIAVSVYPPFLINTAREKLLSLMRIPSWAIATALFLINVSVKKLKASVIIASFLIPSAVESCLYIYSHGDFLYAPYVYSGTVFFALPLFIYGLVISFSKFRQRKRTYAVIQCIFLALILISGGISSYAAVFGRPLMRSLAYSYMCLPLTLICFGALIPDFNASILTGLSRVSVFLLASVFPLWCVLRSFNDTLSTSIIRILLPSCYVSLIISLILNFYRLYKLSKKARSDRSDPEIF